MPPIAIVGGVVAAIVIGGIAGLYPAARAAASHPPKHCDRTEMTGSHEAPSARDVGPRRHDRRGLPRPRRRSRPCAIATALAEDRPRPSRPRRSSRPRPSARGDLTTTERIDGIGAAVGDAARCCIGSRARRAPASTLVASIRRRLSTTSRFERSHRRRCRRRCCSPMSARPRRRRRRARRRRAPRPPPLCPPSYTTPGRHARRQRRPTLDTRRRTPRRRPHWRTRPSRALGLTTTAARDREHPRRPRPVRRPGRRSAPPQSCPTPLDVAGREAAGDGPTRAEADRSGSVSATTGTPAPRRPPARGSRRRSRRSSACELRGPAGRRARTRWTALPSSPSTARFRRGDRCRRPRRTAPTWPSWRASLVALGYDPDLGGHGRRRRSTRRHESMVEGVAARGSASRRPVLSRSARVVFLPTSHDGQRRRVRRSATPSATATRC